MDRIKQAKLRAEIGQKMSGKKETNRSNVVVRDICAPPGCETEEQRALRRGALKIKKEMYIQSRG